MTSQNLWDAVKAVLRGKFIAKQAYLRKQGKSQISDLTLHLKELEKEEQTKPKVSRRKEIIKIRAEINKIETKKKKEKKEKLNETKSWFLEKINKIDKPLARLTKKNKERAKINKIRNENTEVIANTTEIQKIIRNYHEQLYANNMDNLEEVEKFLEMYNLLKLD